MPNFVSHACLQFFLFGAFVTMIYWPSTEVLLNLVAPLESAVPSLDFEQINIFWPTAFNLLSCSRRLSKSCCSLNLDASSFDFEFCCLHLLLVYYSVQLSHTFSDFSHLLKVMISETTILCHFILVLLSLILMKQMTFNVGIISLIHIFGLNISGCDLLQVTGTDASCVFFT